MTPPAITAQSEVANKKGLRQGHLLINTFGLHFQSRIAEKKLPKISLVQTILGIVSFPVDNEAFS